MNWLRTNWKYIVAALAVIGWGIHVYQAIKTGQPIPAPPVIVVDNGKPDNIAAKPAPVTVPDAAQGWIADPDEVASVVASLPPTLRVFSDTPAGKTTEALPKFVYGWKAYEQLFARPPPIKNQGSVGACVSFGTNTAVERTLSGEILRRKGQSAEWTRYVEEATYGGSRVEIGGGRVRGDGSVGAWAAQFITKYGMVPRKQYPQADLNTYSESRCREWGSKGVPPEFEAIAKTFPVKSFVQVKVFEELKAALAQGYFVAVCSNQGFASNRDANGVARASGSWAHCMAIDGYHIDTDGREYAHIVNSWGTEWISGPTGWGNPGGDGFWAESSVVDRMLKQGDSWAFSGVTGFPARRVIDWNVLAPLPRDLFARRPFTRELEKVLAW